MTYKNRYYFSTVKDKPYHEIFTDHWFSKNEVYVVWLLLVIFQHCKNIVDELKKKKELKWKKMQMNKMKKIN
jgi:hypothetical protein